MLDTLTIRRLTRMVTPKAAARLRAFRRDAESALLGKIAGVVPIWPRPARSWNNSAEKLRNPFAGHRLSAMRSPMPCIMVLLFALAISAAAAEDVKRQDVENRIELPGFSILPPAGCDWRPYSAPQQGILVMFSKTKNTDQGAEKLQSFVLLGTSRFVELPYEDNQQLRDKLRENLRA
jgi:hypothetical protein